MNHPTPTASAQPKPLRIAVLNFMHETVTFLANDTTLDDFVYPGSPARDEALLQSDPRGYLGGFVKLAREFTGVELVGIESPLFPKTDIGSGWVTNEAFEHFVGVVIAELRRQGPFDGVYMALHGAMGVRGVERPEAELARRVREVVGPDAVLIGTFDPHGNEDEVFLHYANLAFTTKYYPHYDCYLQGERAARAMVRSLRGDYKVAHVTKKVPIISPTVVQWTSASPWMDLVQRALTWEAREPDAFVNVFFGFPWADTPDAGMTIQVMTNDRPALAEEIAADMAQTAWRKRDALLNSTRIHEIGEGVELARHAVANGATPVVLADHSDRSGAATWLLKSIIDHGMARVLVATVTDADVLDKVHTLGIRAGDAFDMPVGGRVDESAGEPATICGTVLHVSDPTGSSGWISVGFGDGNVLVISRYLMQIMTPAALTAMGFDLTAYDVIAIKSRVHFRRGFDDSGFAKTIVLVEPAQSFLGTVRLDGLNYKFVDLKQYYPYGNPEFDAAERQAL
ncbi:M81 family metallopeptidase [Paraburkholderia fungorum]|uniref:M81 family metallopeptidase n=1 Tax=Paraburkholderia fungorum TaxID=134537 RepID=UPI00248E6289|nr:M81 family metallopeptidase [Paraburkholderia fungorum]